MTSSASEEQIFFYCEWDKDIFDTTGNCVKVR